MRSFLYRLYIRLMWLNVAVRRLGFQLYLHSRKDRLAGADLSFLDLSRIRLRVDGGGPDHARPPCSKVSTVPVPRELVPRSLQRAS